MGHGLMYDKGLTRLIEKQAHPPPNSTFFPLAMPGITGPGAIAVMIVIGISTEVRELPDLGSQALAYALTVMAMAGVCFVEGQLQRSAPRVSERLGPVGVEVMRRLSGFLLICVGVQFIASGIRTLIAGG
jgi:multiple antibiotic resistance protein